jgi:hypothetical protein
MLQHLWNALTELFKPNRNCVRCLPIVAGFTSESGTFDAAIRELPRPCGHPEFLVDIWYVDRDKLPAVLVPSSELQELIPLLNDCARYAEIHLTTTV